MPPRSLRGPPDLLDGFKAMAAQNHRRMQEQARLLIERAWRWRERMRDRPMPHLLNDLRAHHDR